MSNQISDGDAALTAHKIVLAHFVAEAELRLGDEASAFLAQIRRAAITSVMNAAGDIDETDLRRTKQRIIQAIEAIFG